MITLDIESIKSPYNIEKSISDGMFKFITDFGVEYSIGFLPDDIIQAAESYEFIIANTNHKPSPNDHKVQDTIIAFIDGFFSQNNFPILYLCETSDGKQAMRNRLFQHWFSQYDKQGEFMFLSSSIVDLEGVTNYATLVIKNDHPKLREVIDEFTDTVQTLKNKPV